MDYQEAVEWLNGNRSMTNIIPQDPFETWLVRIAEADAAMTQQAYWIVKAHKDANKRMQSTPTSGAADD